MDYLTELGSLALGSRLKRLAERLSAEVTRIYESQGLDFEPRWFPIFHLLAGNSEMSIMDIAKAIGVTHPAVNQIAQEMLAQDLLLATVDPDDKRRRCLSLSKKGRKLSESMSQAWRLIHISINDALHDSQHDVLKSVQAFEASLDKKDLAARFADNITALKDFNVRIVDFAAKYKQDFRRLNAAWIEKYFVMEEADEAILASPEAIVRAGGNVFFACVENRVVGTCALVKLKKNEYEIAKMAVSEDFRGLGIGRLLLEACIKRARQLDANVLHLETATRLEHAIKLYKSMGFKIVENPHPSAFSRVDLAMKLDLKPLVKIS